MWKVHGSLSLKWFDAWLGGASAVSQLSSPKARLSPSGFGSRLCRWSVPSNVRHSFLALHSDGAGSSRKKDVVVSYVERLMDVNWWVKERPLLRKNSIW